MDTWQSKHPEDWNNSDILDWIYFTAGLKNIQLPSLRGENFQGMTGKEFCKMTSEDFKSKDSNFGEKLTTSNKTTNTATGNNNTTKSTWKGLLPNSYASPNQAVSHPVFINTPFNFQKYRPQQQHQQPPLNIAPNVLQPIKQESQVLSNEQPSGIYLKYSKLSDFTLLILNQIYPETTVYSVAATDKTSVPLTELTASSSCRPAAQLVFPSLIAPIGYNFSLAQHQRQFPFSFKNNLYQYVIQQALLQQQQQLQQLQLQIQQQTQQQQLQQHNLHKERQQNPQLFLPTTQCDPCRIVETKTIKKLLASNEVKETEKMKKVKEVEEVKVALIPSTVMESNLLDSSDEEDDPFDQTKTKNFQPIQPNINLKEDAQAKHFKVKSLNKLKVCPVTTKKRKREDDCDEDKEKITANNCHNENDSSVVTSISSKVSKAKANKIISDDDQAEQKSVKKKHTSSVLSSENSTDIGKVIQSFPPNQPYTVSIFQSNQTSLSFFHTCLNKYSSELHIQTFTQIY
ncbi:hypothetical protein HELRODRAFT_160574 [Helobdella robusta]|uniref:PNT domain-containing protein n=1 Tax=Helobdella robusta TaxID=6412 RepID=T1EQF6_HELRO|nr:hypothetical protein HELRODRAFT_160574 [Helobdella robusta]ESO06403.1 hypothetical protein HELRODRAFT_160574 [Helobdella robusta]